MATKGERGHFFTIDSRLWPGVTRCGTNSAAAYLVLACGTGKDNRISRWSTNAVMNHAGMGWERAKKSVETLKDGCFVRPANGRMPDRPAAKGEPQFEFTTFSEWWNFEVGRDPYDLWPIRDLQQGKQPKGKIGRSRAESLYSREILVRDADGRYSFPEGAEGGSGESLIWLPNTIVTGTLNGEESPVRRLRAAGCPSILRLFVDLYSAHNLRDDGGINPCVIRQNFERMQVGEQGAYTIWAFRPGQLHLRWTGPFEAHRIYSNDSKMRQPIWDHTDALQRMGLLSFVPHIFESDSEDAEPIHAYGIDGSEVGADPLEIEIGNAAYGAAVSMCLPSKLNEAEAAGFCYLCPLSSSLTNAQMIGIARLTYRPHTRRTGAWSANLHATAPGLIERFRQLASKGETAAQRRESRCA